jgi:hypothetical protein
MQRFTVWLESKKPVPLIPPSDRLVQLIVAAGAGGISYSDLIHGIELDREVIDGLLDALVNLGMVEASGVGEGRVYRYSCRLT